MRILITTLILILLFSPLIAAEEAYDFSVDVNDNLTYFIQHQSYEGEFTVEFTEVSAATTEPVNIEPKVYYTVIAKITGELAPGPARFAPIFGWEKILYAEGMNLSVTAVETTNPLFSVPYEDNYPLIWPASDDFMENWADERSDIVLSKEGRSITLVEEVDNSPLDGCLCSTIVEIQNGVTTKIKQNETYYFTASGVPENDYHEITLISDVPNNYRLGDSTQTLQPMFFAFLLILLPLRYQRKFRR